MQTELEINFFTYLIAFLLHRLINKDLRYAFLSLNYCYRKMVIYFSLLVIHTISQFLTIFFMIYHLLLSNKCHLPPLNFVRHFAYLFLKISRTLNANKSFNS